MSAPPTTPPVQPAAVEDEDTKEAFQALLAADKDATAALTGGLSTGPIVSGVVIGTRGETVHPYARIECDQGPKANEYIAPVQPGSGYHDFRKVTIEVLGIKAEMLAALGHLRRLYDWQPKGTKPMVIPNAVVKHVMPLPGCGKVEEQKERVSGNPVWKGTLVYQVWTVRTVP